MTTTLETAEDLGVTLRPLRPEDVPALVALVVDDDHACTMIGLDAGDREALLERSLTRTPLVYTILVDGDVAGMRYLSPKQDERGVNLATGSFLGAEHRGRHVGRVALQEVLAACAKQNVAVVSALVDPTNEAAARSLAATGFTLVDEDATRTSASGQRVRAHLWETTP